MIVYAQSPQLKTNDHSNQSLSIQYPYIMIVFYKALIFNFGVCLFKIKYNVEMYRYKYVFFSKMNMKKINDCNTLYIMIFFRIPCF